MQLFVDSKKYCSIHDLIEVLIAAIEEKDYYTKGHSDRVANISSHLCDSLQLTEFEVNRIHMAAHLHDLGKIYIPDNILNKNGKLTPLEWNEIKKHPIIGSRLLDKVTGFNDISLIVKHHHERWDGKGYPSGLSGKAIPIGSRIIALSDSIDAMMSKRAYRDAMLKETCIEELFKGAGSQFDPALVPLAVHYLIDTETVPLEIAYPPTLTDNLVSR